MQRFAPRLQPQLSSLLDGAGQGARSSTQHSWDAAVRGWAEALTKCAHVFLNSISSHFSIPLISVSQNRELLTLPQVLLVCIYYLSLHLYTSGCGLLAVFYSIASPRGTATTRSDGLSPPHHQPMHPILNKQKGPRESSTQGMKGALPAEHT